MTEEFHQQIGKMLASLEANTSLTKDIAKDVGEIKTHLSNLNGRVGGHDTYLKNLEERVVEGRKNNEGVDKRITILETKSDTNTTYIKWLSGIVGSVIVTIASYFITKQ